MDDAWRTIGDIVNWLDASTVLPAETEKLLRIMKLTEEAGEVTQAVIGVMGQNPRKGVTHTWDDVQAELCDVMFTAMVALTTLTPDAPKIFDAHLARVADRSLQGPDRTAATRLAIIAEAHSASRATSSVGLNSLTASGMP